MGTRDEAIAAAKAKLLQEQDAAVNDALGSVYDQGLADQKAIDPASAGFTQADIDKAVSDAKAADAQALSDLQAADAKALSDAQAQGAAALSDLQKKLDDMTSKEQAEEAVVSGLQSSVAAVQSALDAIKALVLPVPPAPPVPPAQ